MKTTIILNIILCFLIVSCTDGSHIDKKEEVKTKFQNKGHELVFNMTQKVGNYDKFMAKKSVAYTYTYKTPNNETDISTEMYIFDGELSYGKYQKHERTLPQLEGIIEQGYDGKEYWLKHNGIVLNDPKNMQRVVFNRATNFYWFTMMQKLMDPGIIYEHLGEQMIDNQDYDLVKITFNNGGVKPTDIYQLYINKETLLVDQFLFTVADFGVMETPNLMKLKYEEIEGLLIPTKRLYKKSTWNADVDDKPWIDVTWSNIKFNKDIMKENFKKENSMEKNESTTLKSKLDEKKARFEKRADDNKKRAYKEGLQSVEKSNITNTAKQVGDTAPNFKLNNALGKTVSLKDYLAKGKVVLTWYRGGWCPYCNLTLHELQEELPNFKLNGANLLALTPELPDKSISTSEKHDLEFEILSDVGNKIAREYGIVFKLTDEVAEMYNKSFDMNGYNGDESNELPLAATYIINEDGKIIYAFLDADYRNRAEPSDLTKILRGDKN